MSKTLLVSLVSDQTIPNVQLIKQLGNNETDYFFITTKGMENKGTRVWIENACKIPGEKIKKIEVNQFSFSDIKTKLNQYDFSQYEKILVNLTGGTKIMTLVASDFFKSIKADIYYITGQNNEFIKIFPEEEDSIKTFKYSASLQEYLTAYGFSLKKSTPSGISFEQTEKIFKAFCTINIMDYNTAVQLINSNRNRKIDEKKFDIVSDFLDAIEYTPIHSKYLTKEETKYLSGDWFEEYIGLKIKEELDLTNDNIFISTELEKESSQTVRNDTALLLGEKSESKLNKKNEIDVMFMYNNKFYSIECKTSIIAYRPRQKNNEIIEKSYNILGETIYKSDSLAKRFGLFADTSILTLTDFKEYCESKDLGEHNNKISEMEEIINRANLSNIKLIDKNLLTSGKPLYELIGIKKN